MLDYNKIISKFDTPTYIYDIEELNNRLDYLKSKFNKDYNFVYAVKANTFIAKEVDKKVDRFEICSKGEFDICHNLGLNHNKMVISGVNKDNNFIESIISNYDDILKYTIESYNQYKLLDNLSIKYDRVIHVLIRLTSGNQFGVSVDDLKRIIEENKNELLVIDGIEYFSGTQKHSLKRIEKEIDMLNELVEDIENNMSFEIHEIEYGPGLPVFYYQDDVFDEDSFLNDINDIIGKITNKVISLEIGRSIAASCGSYVTKVVDIKNNKNGNFVIVDGGINHLVYYGQTMAMKIPFFEILPKKEKEKEVYNLCGSLCTINDFLVKNIEVPKLDIGDIFVFKRVGAYSSTEGISLFLSRDLPKIVVHTEKDDILVRENIKTSYLNFPNYEMEDKKWIN